MFNVGDRVKIKPYTFIKDSEVRYGIIIELLSNKATVKLDKHIKVYQTDYYFFFLPISYLELQVNSRTLIEEIIDDN